MKAAESAKNSLFNGLLGLFSLFSDIPYYTESRTIGRTMARNLTRKKLTRFFKICVNFLPALILCNKVTIEKMDIS